MLLCASGDGPASPPAVRKAAAYKLPAAAAADDTNNDAAAMLLCAPRSSPFNALPMEMVVTILSFVAPADVIEFSCTCRRFRGVRRIAERMRIARCAIRLHDAPTLTAALVGHMEYVEKVAVNASVVLTASYDRSIGVTAPEGFAVCGRIAVKDQVWGLALSSDGRRAFSCGRDGVIAEWDVSNPMSVAKAAEYTGHTNGISGVSVTPNGRLLVSSSADMTARVWDIATRRCVRVLEGPGRLLECACTNKYVAAGSFSGKVRLWRIDTGEMLIDWVASANVVDPVEFSPNDRYLAAGSNDGKITLFDLADLSVVRVIRVYAIAGQGQPQASGGLRLDKHVRQSILPLPSGPRDAGTPSGLRGLRTAVFSPRRRLASSPPGAPTAPPARHRPDPPRAPATAQRPLWVYGDPVPTEQTTMVFGLAFSPCGKYLAAACGDGTSRVYSVETGELRQVLAGHKSWVRSVAWSACGFL